MNARIRQLAFLNKSIRLVLCDEREAEPKRLNINTMAVSAVCGISEQEQDAAA